MSGDWDAFSTRRRTGRRGCLVRRLRSSMPACRRIPRRDPRSTNFRRRFVPQSRAATMLFALAATLATGAVADAPAPRSLRAARRTGEIRIDGRADEPAWLAADVGDNFLQTEPDDGQPATAPTQLRVLWDDDSLYVAIECDDPQPPTALASPRDRDIDADLVRIDLDTTLDRRTA